MFAGKISFVLGLQTILLWLSIVGLVNSLQIAKQGTASNLDSWNDFGPNFKRLSSLRTRQLLLDENESAENEEGHEDDSAKEGESEEGGTEFDEEIGGEEGESQTESEDEEPAVLVEAKELAGDGSRELPKTVKSTPLVRGKPLSYMRLPPKNGKARVEHGRWVQTAEGSSKWIFVAKAECPDSVCPGTVADENLRQMLDLDTQATDQDLYNTVLSAKAWYKLSDKGMREQSCRGHKHEVEFWCKGQAGVQGQMAVELDQYEQDWRQKAITRQKAKFAMLEYAKQRRAHEEEHSKAMSTIAQAKELLNQKKKALMEEENKVKEMENKVKEALKMSAAQMAAGEEALKQKELEEMVAWQQMQNKRQLVVKFRALNKADISEMIRQQREEDRDKAHEKPKVQHTT